MLFFSSEKAPLIRYATGQKSTSTSSNISARTTHPRIFKLNIKAHMAILS